MSSGCVKTVLLCSDVWREKELYLQLPPLFMDDRIHLSLEIKEIGKIEGLFQVEDILHDYDSRTGYCQRVEVLPL